MCVRTPYATEREANSVIAQRYRGRKFLSTRERSNRIYSSVKCDVCEMYHITSRNGLGGATTTQTTKGTTENG